MAAQILASGYEARALAREEAVMRAETEDEMLSRRGVAGAGVVAMAAMLLAAAPVLVAVVAIISPSELDRVYGWLVGGSIAFSLVAAGRVPAAALLVFVLGGRRTRS